MTMRGALGLVGGARPRRLFPEAPEQPPRVSHNTAGRTP